MRWSVVLLATIVLVLWQCKNFQESESAPGETTPANADPSIPVP